MRVVVASPPKSGNHWVKCLLARIYDLSIIEGEDKPRLTPEALPRWVASGGFPENSIVHIHNKCSRRLCDAIDAVPAHLVTILRDPYDMFVSLYHWAQERAERNLDSPERSRPRHALVDKPIDDPEVLAFIENEYGATLRHGLTWLRGERAHIVRYERLHEDPIAELTALTAAIAPAPEDRITAAIDACRADRMRGQDEKMHWHVRSARVGDARDALGPAHLERFRRAHRAVIHELGYDVR
ncbi:MAG: sulfotransferase domain-containing protein [Thermomicrobiales bacterium]|nr:sulfotransferase domain-containing protein [Thermomicrobiales bacterium]